MGVTKQLAEHLVNTTYDDLSPEVIDRAKHLFLNFLGVTLDGATGATSKTVIEHVRRIGARQDASVIGTDYKTTAAFAAYVNGASAHAHELEAVGGSFNSAPSISAALAIAEQKELTGKQLIEGFVVGYDIQGRVINGARVGIGKKGWIMCMNHVGPVSVACKMNGLDVDQTRAGMGTSLAEASGMQSSAGFYDHYLAFSFPAYNGIDAAEYALQGFGGNPDCLDVEEGFLDFFAGLDSCDFELMVKDLGKDWGTIIPPGTGIKKYPCCYASHKAVDATLELIEEHNIEYDDVETIQVETNKMILGWLQYPEPGTEHHARFSMPHILASALLNKRVWLEAVTDPKVVYDSKYVEARDKVKIKLNETWSPGTEGYRSPITITMKDGTVYEKEVENISEPDSDGLLDLYRTIVEPHMSSDDIEKTIDVVMNLEKQDNINALMALYTK